MLKDHETTWKACLNVIKDNISLQAFKVWFEPIIPVKLEKSILTIQVPSHFFYEWLEQHYIGLLSKVIKKEIGLTVTDVFDKLGDNEYVANHPEKGKHRKQVIYFLAESEYKPLALGESGGLDDAKWFKLKEILDLNFYDDILPLVTKAIKRIAQISTEK
jgi:hypothetical protein